MNTLEHIITKQEIDIFIETIWSYYSLNKREFPWRSNHSPYSIVVSEIMLQQTQTDRVLKKYEHFLSSFPSFESLAQASLKEVLAAWQGLGYNRRGLALQSIAQIIIREYAGNLPNNPTVLINFPGIGKATASSICAFAFNMPTLFIETNIRTVFIHFFFKDRGDIKDSEIMPLIEASVDFRNPREWYYALMDYGVMLKKSLPNPSRKSAHHTKQSKFEGSDRQIRGMILKILTSQSHCTLDELCSLIPRETERIQKALRELKDEKFIDCTKNLISIA